MVSFAGKMKLFICIFFSLFGTQHLIGQWELIDSPINDGWVSHLAVTEDHIWAVTVWDGFWIQHKETGQWEEIISLPDSIFIQDIATQSEIAFVIDYNYAIYRSNDLGSSWKNISPQQAEAFSELYVDGSSIFIGGNIELNTNTAHLYVSKDTGNVWEPFKFNIGNNVIWPSMFARKGNIIFTATDEKVYRSFDNGEVWEAVLNNPDFEEGCPLCEIEHLFTSDSMVVAVEMNDYYVSKRLHVSMDNGDHWEIVDFGYPSMGFFAGLFWYGSIDNILLALDYADTKGIYVSFDGGHSSVFFNDGLGSLNVRDIVSDGDYMYAGVGGNGVWRRNIQELYLTSTKNIIQHNEISIFPNPSNGNFTIKLNSNLSGEARLVIYDLHGRTFIKTTVDLNTQTEIEAGNLSSGLYILTLQAGDRIYTSKLVIQH